METLKYRGKTFEVNDHMNNAAICIDLLDDDLMRKARFTDLSEGYWYYCRDLEPLAHGISFNLRVEKTNPKNWTIDVLDEAFLQPYDYQSMIQNEYEKNVETLGKFHWVVNSQVEYEMEHLTRLGIVSGWEKGDYT